MQNVTIGTGPASVLDTGTVTAFFGHPLVFACRLDGHRIGVVMTFVSDPEVDDVAVRSTWLDDVLRLELVNFDGADGRGSAQPVMVQEIGDRRVYMHFRVQRFGNTDDRTVHWTFYVVATQDMEGSPAPGS